MRARGDIAGETGSAESHFRRGNDLLELERFEEAVSSFDEALALNPNLAAAYNNRGNALAGLKRLEQALASIDRAAALKPQSAEILFNRANVLLGLERAAEAVADYDRAISLKPAFAEALFRRGNALYELRRYEDAIASYDRSLEIKPSFPAALNNRGNALSSLDRFEDALVSYDRAFQLAPDLPYLAGSRLHAKMRICDWRDFAQERARLDADVMKGGKAAWPFVFMTVSGSPEAQHACAQACVLDRYPPAASPLCVGQPYAHERIRVAYVSADFCDHPMPLLLAGMFEQHDRSRFEVTAISLGAGSRSPMRARLEKAFDHFIEVQNWSDGAIASLIREREIDIAVDLMGFTKGAKTGIFALRPAPIQVSYVGFPATMGAPYIDYLIADAIVVPPGERRHYTEKLVYLPDCYLTNDSRRAEVSPAPPREQLGLPSGKIVFCSFNNPHKLAPEIFGAWMGILSGIEDSILWLLAGNPRAANNLRLEASKRGVASERMVFAPRLAQDVHLARLRAADLFFDALPYNAHTTACDALWAGLPVLTCAGTSFAGRVAASALTAIGMPELIANSLQEYAKIAIELARDPARLAQLKATLTRNRNTSPLFRTELSVRNVESAYEQMVARHKRGEPPQSFAVAPHKPNCCPVA